MQLSKKQTIVDESLGKQYGKLTVEKFVGFRQTPRGRKTPIVECKCVCGQMKEISLWDVRSGKTKTCGLNHPQYDDRSLPAFNFLYDHSYRRRAVKAGLEFNLSRDEFRSLTQQNCHYCGAAPASESHRGVRGQITSGKYLSQYIYNGLDRVDSSRGYTLDNVVPCCGTCNHAKHTMGYETFVGWLDRIAEFRRTSDQVVLAIKNPPTCDGLSEVEIVCPTLP